MVNLYSRHIGAFIKIFPQSTGKKSSFHRYILQKTGQFCQAIGPFIENIRTNNTHKSQVKNPHFIGIHSKWQLFSHDRLAQVNILTWKLVIASHAPVPEAIVTCTIYTIILIGKIYL